MKSLLSKLAILVIICTTSATAFAQGGPKGNERGGKGCPEGQEIFMKDMAEKRDKFIIKSLELTEEQQETFLPIYKEMKEEIKKVHEALKADVEDIKPRSEDITDAQYQKATKAMIEINANISKIESDYYNNKFSKTLSAKQLYKLKNSEEQFMRRMLENHRQGGGNGGNKGGERHGAPEGGRGR